VLGPTRPFPKVGAPARIKHFGGQAESGVVVAVEGEGRRLRVRGEDGELYEFVLSPANARFVPAGDAHGPRLELMPDGGAQSEGHEKTS
jgi:hypothetical protein